MNAAIPHPRETFDVLGAEAVDGAFLDAMRRGRLHHAWLLVGAEGVGKATFAYRAARRLLGAAPDPAYGPLGSAPDHPVSRQVLGRAHPDLIVLQRDAEDGKTRKGIPVDEARGLPDFFSKSPASAPYRVAIIDAADDLNANAANAVLKTLEEPPERGVLFLVSHSPGALIATLRSRCRRLRFEPPPPDATASWLAGKAGVAADEAERLTAMARGAPGLAWRLAGGGALEMDDAARALLRGLPDVDTAAVMALTDGFRGPAGAVRFALFFDRLAEAVRAGATQRIASGEGVGGGLARWAEAWAMLIAAPREAEAVNLDRIDVFHTALAHLRAIA